MSTVTIELDEKYAGILNAIANQTGAAPGEVVGSALELLADATLFDDSQPPLTPEQIAAIEEGLAAAARGDLIPHEQVVAEMRAKFGR
jgi:predicted transcriptional regulator